MGLPVEINPLFVSSTSGYQVGRSLRFRSSASAYLSRTVGTPSTTTNTISVWVKRGAISSAYHPILACTNSNSILNFQLPSTSLNDTLQYVDNNTTILATNAVYRDPSAWYHVVFVWDTTNATAANRLRLYVNGSQVTSFNTSSYPAQNTAQALFNSGNTWQIGSRQFPGALYYDGYMAEFVYVDGQALTASSFGAYDTNGVWQPKKYTGTYGTNGFYLPFSNTTSTTTLVADSSGNGNNWTPNNISLTAGTTYDSMIDSPTVSASASNYAVVNPLDSTNAPTNGNLTFTTTGSSQNSTTSIKIPSSGKWYCEVTMTSMGGAGPTYLGLINNKTASNVYAYASDATKYSTSGGSASYGATYTTGDVIAVAVDVDNGNLSFYKNNTSQGNAFTGLSSATLTTLSFGVTTGSATGRTFDFNFGQRPFTYTPPTGFNALNTYNLPAATITNGAQYMAATLWTGADTGTGRSITNGGNNTLGTTFAPDFWWTKLRAGTGAYSHQLFDSVRGAGSAKALASDATGAEGYGNGATYGYLSSFDSSGVTFTRGSAGSGANPDGYAYYDELSATYVGWSWKAGGTGVTNTSGTITSTVSANTSAGFSIVTYTGNGTAGATIGHGLGVAPSMVIIKSRSGVRNWQVYHASIGNTGAVYLNTTSATVTASTNWNNTSPTSSVVSLGTDGNVNANTETYVAYCFAAISGYSAFNSYTGNGSTDGPFIYTGFRPRYIMTKATTVAGEWEIYDTSRSTYNVVTSTLEAQSSSAELNFYSIDILSNGFKQRQSYNTQNQSGQTYIYMAFAENPFNYSRAR